MQLPLVCELIEIMVYFPEWVLYLRLKAPRSLGLFLILLGAPVLGMGQVVRKPDAWSSHPLIGGLGLPCIQETAETRSWGGRKGDDVLGDLCPLEEIEPSGQ